MSMYIINTHKSPSRLFICEGGEIFSQEGTTQGDPLSMFCYSVNTATMIQSLKLNIPEFQEGKKCGYQVSGPKCLLIVKTQDLAGKAQQILGEEVNITTEGKRHLGAVIGSKEYKDQHCIDKVQGWVRVILSLAEIAKSQPPRCLHCPVALTKAYKSNLPTLCEQLRF